MDFFIDVEVDITLDSVKDSLIRGKKLLKYSKAATWEELYDKQNILKTYKVREIIKLGNIILSKLED